MTIRRFPPDQLHPIEDPHRFDGDGPDECLDGNGRALAVCERPRHMDNTKPMRGDGKVLGLGDSIDDFLKEE